MKLISPEQIESLLRTFYSTNITAKDFDVIKDFFAKLPEQPEEEKVSPKK
jgi:hypothetical protein